MKLSNEVTDNQVRRMMPILLACALLLAGCGPQIAAYEYVEGTAELSLNEHTVPVKFSRKVDGDTAWFICEGEEIKVRFLAVDTPETVKEGTEVQDWGPEASEYTENRLKSAEQIYLEFDPESDLQDSYDRYLAWVWTDGSLLEEELVMQGYAEVAYLYGDYKYTDLLLDAEEQAKAEGLGIWS